MNVCDSSGHGVWIERIRREKNFFFSEFFSVLNINSNNFSGLVGNNNNVDEKMRLKLCHESIDEVDSNKM
jgi:hypothetical protein